MKVQFFLRVLLLFIQFSFSILAFPQRQLKFDHISLEQGLSQNTVRCIFQDSKGFMWFGTQDGLNRYDGYHFKVYTYKPGVSNSISNNYVYAILEDANGTLWIATRDGLNQFDPVKETFTHYHHKPDDPGSLSHNFVKSLHLDNKGVLWIGTYDGMLNRFETDTRSFTRYFHKSEMSPAFARYSINAIAGDHAGNLWLGTADDGLYRFDPINTRFTHYCREPGNPNSISDDKVTAIVVEHRGSDECIWISTWGGGLNRFEPAVNRFTHYRYEPGNPNSLSSDTIYSLLLTDAGELWVGTTEGLNHHVNHFIRYRQDPSTPRSLKDNRLLSLFQSRSGDIWIGTANSGIQRLFSHRKPFALYRSEPGNPTGLNANSIHAIYEDNDDARTLWIGTRGGGLNRFDRTQQKFTYYKNEPGNPYSLSHNEVKAILRDSAGVLWVGTYGGGLNRFLESQKRFIRYLSNPQTPGSLSSNYISCLFEDSDHVLWIGTMNAGLNRFHKDIEGFSCYRAEAGNPSGLSHYLIRTICQCKKKPEILWIGTDGGGLNRFDKTTGHFTHYRHKRHTPASISSDIILALYQDRESIIWIGTGGGGLNRFDPLTGQFDLFTDKEGLPNNTVYGILEDNHGNLWLSTNRGLSKFDPARRIFRNYSVEDGLQSNEFNYGAAFKSKSGELFFGGVNGFNAFYPDKIQDNPYIPPVVITDFRLFNKTVPIGKGPGGRIILEKSITETESITLSHQDYVISLEYAALNYEFPEKNQYAYIMEGFEKEWNRVGTRRFATYTNLPPGEYTFRVKGSNNDGKWNQQGRWIRIFVRPPFWKTWWFTPLVFLLIISTSLFLLQVKIRKDMAAKQHLENEVSRRTLELETIIAENTRLLQQLQKANQHLEEARKEAEQEREAAEDANLSKSQFLARMSHEIRTPMNGVIGFIDMLMDTKLSEEQIDYVKSIHTSGQVLLALINDILDFSKIEAGQLSLDQVDFDPEVTAFDVCDLIRPRIGNKPVEVICHIERHVPAYVRSDPGRFRQVLVNLMGNAAKFTETGEIQLSLEVEQEEEKDLLLHTTVRDTGIGIPKKKLGSVFEIFQQADGTITRQYGGSGLGLAICKQISHLMEGDVWVESKEGKGSTFHFTARVKKPERKTPLRRVRESLTGKKILVVDDNRNNLKVLTLMLEQAGMRVTGLTTGKKAAAIIREAAASQDPYHLCILDVLMPDMDGYEVAKQVRQLTAPLCDIPLLAFSSSTMKRAKYFKESGFNAFLPKPCQRQKILDMIERLVDEKRIKKDKEKGETIITQYTLSDEAKHSVNILLVEDNALNQKLARYMLTRAGYQLEVAVNGKEAVDRYTSDPERYDLIFMDIQMPEMNGMEATQAIREKGFKNVPIIAMTAQSLKGDREKCLEAGMNDYISKPIKREAVFQMVKKWALKKSNC